MSPLPLTVEISIPFSEAIFLAKGEILILPPVEVVVETVAFTAGTDSVFGASVATGAATFPPPATIADTSVPAGPIIAKISSTFVAFPSETPW